MIDKSNLDKFFREVVNNKLGIVVSWEGYKLSEYTKFLRSLSDILYTTGRYKINIDNKNFEVYGLPPKDWEYSWHNAVRFKKSEDFKTRNILDYKYGNTKNMNYGSTAPKLKDAKVISIEEFKNLLTINLVYTDE